MAYSDNINAGSGKVTVTARESGNYDFEPVTETFAIARAAHEDGTARGDAKYGQSDSVELADLIEPGGSAAVESVTGKTEIFSVSPAINGTVLDYAFKDDKLNMSKTATATVRISGCLNYNDYKIAVTLTVAPDEDFAGMVKELEEEDKNIKTDVTTKPGENGSTETVVSVGGKEVSKTVVTKDGEITTTTDVWISGLKEEYRYTGAVIKPEPRVYDGTKQLIAGTDYTVVYKNNKNASDENNKNGLAVLTVKFKGNYKNTEPEGISFKIEPAKLGIVSENSVDVDVVAEDLAVATTGRVQKPAPVITWTKDGKSISKSGFDFAYYKADGTAVNGVNAGGTYKVEVTLKNSNKNFTGKTVATITVVSAADKNKLMSKASVRFTPNKYTYTGSEIKPSAGSYKVKIGNTELKEGTHYTVRYSNNIEPGKAIAVFTAIPGGGYYGSKTVNFNISKGKVFKKQGEAGSTFKYEYDVSVPFAKGGAKPKVVVWDGTVRLEQGRDYKVSYKNNRAVAAIDAKNKNGKDIAPKIVITGKGNYKWKE